VIGNGECLAIKILWVFVGFGCHFMGNGNNTITIETKIHVLWEIGVDL
jgi:hypothetical protein